MKKPLDREQNLRILALANKRNKRNKKPPVKSSNNRNHQPPLMVIALPNEIKLQRSFINIIEKICLLDKRRPFVINFDKLEKMDIAPALMLAAELDVKKISLAESIIKADTSKWTNEWAKNRLMELGFFQLLDSSTVNTNKSNLNESVKYLKFQSGTVKKKLASGTVKKELTKETRDKLEKIMNEIISEENNQMKMKIFEALTEAITNTHQHAYEGRIFQYYKWWASATINQGQSSNIVKIICYDRGVTIPKSILNKKESILRSWWRGEKNDASILESLVKGELENIYMKNRGESGRGQGIPKLKEIIDNNKKGTMRIYSRKGMAEYSLNSGSKPIYNKEKLSFELKGTLIEWEITLH